MYQDSELTKCVVCDGLGLFAPNLWGNITFQHRIPSPRLDGYYAFTQKCGA